MTDLEEWCRLALRAVISLWNTADKTAWRTSADKAAGGVGFRPTVTFNALLTFQEYGLFAPGAYIAGVPDAPITPSEAIARLANPLAMVQRSTQRTGPRQLIFLANYLAAMRALGSVR